MASPYDTPTSPITQQIAVEIQIGEGANAVIVHIPVADAAASLALQQRINKHPGRMVIGEDTAAPMTIHCGRVMFMKTVLLNPPRAVPGEPPAPLKLATLQ